jgi:HK97 family phage prohead protease
VQQFLFLRNKGKVDMETKRNKTNEFFYSEFEIKSADEATGVIEGYASVFKNVDLGKDRVISGAFSKTIKENGGHVPVLSNHLFDKQIGWGLEAEEDKKGLRVKGKLMINEIPEARSHFALIKAAKEIGAKHGMSIGYSAMKWDFDKNTGVRDLKEIKLYEWSLVTFPMNPKAHATAAKQWLEGSLLENAMAFIDSMKDKGHNEEKILTALHRAAKLEEDPDSGDIQSLLNVINQLKTKFKGEN